MIRPNHAHNHNHNHNFNNHHYDDDHAAIPLNRQPQQQGIQRFRKHETDSPDLFLETEGEEEDLFGHTNNNSWEDMNNDGLDDISDPIAETCETERFNGVKNTAAGSDTIFRMESEGQWQPRQPHPTFLEPAHARNISGCNQHETDNTFFEKQDQQKIMSQLQTNVTLPEKSLTRRLSDITSESNSLGGSYYQSQDAGISRFKRIRREMVEGRGRESSRPRHLQSSETIFEQTMLSDGFHKGYPEQNEVHQKSLPQGLRFFDNENEVDISGNLLDAPRSSPTKRELNFDHFTTQQGENRDIINGIRKSPMTSHYRSNNIDKPEWQQTATTSPDTDYLRGTSFGDESIWNFFGGENR